MWEWESLSRDYWLICVYTCSIAWWPSHTRVFLALIVSDHTCFPRRPMMWLRTLAERERRAVIIVLCTGGTLVIQTLLVQTDFPFKSHSIRGCTYDGRYLILIRTLSSMHRDHISPTFRERESDRMCRQSVYAMLFISDKCSIHTLSPYWSGTRNYLRSRSFSHTAYLEYAIS